MFYSTFLWHLLVHGFFVIMVEWFLCKNNCSGCRNLFWVQLLTNPIISNVEASLITRCNQAKLRCYNCCNIRVHFPVAPLSSNYFYINSFHIGCNIGCHGGKGEGNSTMMEHWTINVIYVVKTPKSRGIGYIPKAKTPNSMRIAAAAMPSSEVEVSKDVFRACLKEKRTCIVHSHNHCHCKKGKAIHSYFHHISNAIYQGIL